MKTITNLIFIALLFVTASLSEQEHGPVLGGSLGTLHEKVSVVSSNFEGYKLHYHIGYAYRQYWGNRKFAMYGIALFGSQGTDYQAFNSDSPKYSVNGKYLSIGTVFSYECFSNFRLGVGADVAWYVNRLGASTYNSKKKHGFQEQNQIVTKLLRAKLLSLVHFSILQYIFRLAFSDFPRSRK